MGKQAHSNVIWTDIKKQIELAIINGTYKNASRLPSIDQVAEFYSCGRSTAKKVLDEMYNEGIITKQRGVGYFVKPYVKEKLLNKYYQRLEKDIERVIEEAHDINLDLQMLEELTKEKINKIYSR